MDQMSSDTQTSGFREGVLITGERLLSMYSLNEHVGLTSVLVIVLGLEHRIGTRRSM